MKCEIDFKKIGMRIKTLRNNCNMTQEKLAEKTGLSLSHICNLENGHSKMSVESLITIADTLSVSTDAILLVKSLTVTMMISIIKILLM